VIIFEQAPRLDSDMALSTSPDPPPLRAAWLRATVQHRSTDLFGVECHHKGPVTE
jgi:hypothetical protein